MDTSFWTGLNPTPKFVKTTKLFYNQYLYKIELKLEGLAHYIRWSNRNKGQLLDVMDEFSKRYYDRHLVNINKKLVKFVCDFLVDTKIKKRFEWKFLSLYTNDLNDFKPLIDFLIKENFCSALQYVHLPPKKENLEVAIKSGKIYVKRIPKQFKYRIKLKPNYDFETRLQLVNYLQSIPDEIMISNRLMNNLASKYYVYSHSGYFYCCNESTYLCVKLMAPNIVDGIFELVRD